MLGKEILQGICSLLEILTSIQFDDHVIVGIYKHLAVAGNFRLHLIDVLNGNLIVRIRDRSMSVLFLVQFHHLLFLVRKKDDLIIYQGIYITKAIYVR